MSLFYTDVPKIMIMCYTVPEIQCVTNVILIWANPNPVLGYFFPFTPLTTQKIKF